MEVDSKFEMTDQQRKLFEKWMCPNVFSCKICNKYFAKRRDTFTTHVTRKHKTGIKVYEEKHGKVIETKHQCQECHAQVIHDNLYLTRHFSSVHQGVMTVAQYFVKYILPDLPDGEESEDEEETAVEDQEQNDYETWANLKKHRCKLCKKRSKFKYESALYNHVDNVHNMESKVYFDKYAKSAKSNSATRKCKLCEYQGDTFGMVVYHASKEHDMTSTQYMNKYEPEEDRHQCKLCHKNLSKVRLTSHFQLGDFHRPRITLREYYDKYIKDGGKTEPNNNQNIKIEKMELDNCKENVPNLTLRQKSSLKKWLHPVTHKCLTCKQYSTPSKHNFLHHLSKQHKINQTEYAKQYGQIESRVHRCQLCNKSFQHNARTLKFHFENSHPKIISLEGYFIKYMFGKDKSGAPNPAQLLNDGHSSQAAIVKWSQQCRYSCLFCNDYSQPCLDYVKRHLRNEHQISIWAGKESKWVCVEEKYHKCHRCRKNVLHKKSPLIEHFKACNKSPLTLREYYEKYIIDQDEAQEAKRSAEASEEAALLAAFTAWAERCFWCCPICSFKTSSGGNFHSHLQKEHQHGFKSIEKRYGKDKVFLQKELHKCKLCGKDILRDPLFVKQHTTINHSLTGTQYFEKFLLNDCSVEDTKERKDAVMKITERSLSSWARGISNVCQICQLNSSNPGALKMHLFNIHKINETDYNKVYKQLNVRHNCHLCGKRVVHTRNEIQSHLSSVHKNMPIKEYFEKFILEDLQSRQSNGINNIELVKIECLDLGEGSNYREWLKQLPIECSVCKKEGRSTDQWHSISQFLAHLRKSHGDMTKETYEDKFGGYWKPEDHKYFACQPCGGKMVLHIFDRLNWHANDAHKMSLKEYYKKFVMKKTFRMRDIFSTTST